MPVPSELIDRLAEHGQEHLVRGWDALDEPGRARLEGELAALDLGQLAALVKEHVLKTDEDREGSESIDPAQVAPIDVARLPRTDGERSARRIASDLGAQALANGEVAVVLVAGGQGTRLGFDGPKGTYPIGPVTEATLFQWHAEKIVALGRRHGKEPPLYVMTSPDNHAETLAFFKDHGDFQLQTVRCFVQGTMPAVNAKDGRVLMAAPDALALGPDGHGGTIAALDAKARDGGPSCLEEMRRKGVRTLFYFQVDNPLTQIADPAFLGLHRRAKAEMSFKVIEKVRPGEKLGVVVRVAGRPQVIEYSDLDPTLAERRATDGGLELWAGSVAIHVLELDFVERLAKGDVRLPFHRALKKVPHVDEKGERVEPSAPNAIKFERFIFDALPLAERFAIVETDRKVEFEPLKNATGEDSPASVRQRMSELFADWLESAGAKVERGPDGAVPFPIEIGPLYALDAQELRSKLAPGLEVSGPLVLR